MIEKKFSIWQHLVTFYKSRKNSPRMWLNNTIKVLIASRKTSILWSPSGTRNGSFRPAKQMLLSSFQILATSFSVWKLLRFPRDDRNRLVMIPWSLKNGMEYVEKWFRFRSTYIVHSSVVRLTLLVLKHLEGEVGKRAFSKRISNMLCQWLTKVATSTWTEIGVASDFCKQKIKQEAKSRVSLDLMTIFVQRWPKNERRMKGIKRVLYSWNFLESST